jgi:DNA-binding MarR family transcriptional regulator
MPVVAELPGMELSMDDRVISLHLTPKQRELIRRETGYRPWVLRFRLGELRMRIAIQEGDIEENEQTELDDLLIHARS